MPIRCSRLNLSAGFRFDLPWDVVWNRVHAFWYQYQLGPFYVLIDRTYDEAMLIRRPLPSAHRRDGMRMIAKRIPDNVLMQGCCLLNEHDPAEAVPEGWLLLPEFDTTVPGAGLALMALRQAEAAQLHAVPP